MLPVILLLLAQDVTFRANVPVVIIPVSVTDGKGRPVEGLEARDFTVIDNGKPQAIQLDTADSIGAPLSLVIAIQTNDIANSALLKIQKTGAIVGPLIAGERGAVAVITYGETVRLEQNFTSDTGLVTEAFRKLKSENIRASKSLDAVREALRMLGTRPANSRRVVILIGEGRDRGSAAKLDEALIDIQRQAVTIYPLVYSAYLTAFTTKGSDYKPPAGGFDLIAGISELSRLSKVNTADALAEASGGRKLSFQTLHKLEETLAKIGEELHSQYLLSFRSEQEAIGFHALQVQIKDRPEAKIVARPGYWVDR